MKVKTKPQNQEQKIKVFRNALINQQQFKDSKKTDELSGIAHIACMNSFMSYFLQQKKNYLK
ncbi:MAG: hypothetical protein JXJ04_11560 [Spirochaetales bacterium]|nr:hypothetical protein [Spirochaetales bacterium]